jgi:hypothetical protein
LGDLDVNGRIYWNGLKELRWEIVNWINLAAVGEKWWDVVKTAKVS